MERKQRPPEMEDVWIEQASRGDLDAFNQLVLSYQDSAFNHAYALLGDPALAEDVTQESFIKAFQAMDRFRGGSFRAWLLRIVTNCAYDQLRRSKKNSIQPLFPVNEDGEELDSAAWLADPTPSVQETVEQNELSIKIQNALHEIPAVYRNVLLLVDVDELDYAEAAQALNVPIGTVKSRLSRARIRVQQKLKESLNLGVCHPGAASCLAI